MIMITTCKIITIIISYIGGLHIVARSRTKCHPINMVKFLNLIRLIYFSVYDYSLGLWSIKHNLKYFVKHFGIAKRSFSSTEGRASLRFSNSKLDLMRIRLIIYCSYLWRMIFWNVGTNFVSIV